MLLFKANFIVRVSSTNVCFIFLPKEILVKDVFSSNCEKKGIQLEKEKLETMGNAILFV